MPKAKAGTLKEKIDRTKKKLAEGKEKMTPERARVLRKRVKRSQRTRRSILAAEARQKAKAPKAKSGEGKTEEAAPATT
jgi:hypothetical protein